MGHSIIRRAGRGGKQIVKKLVGPTCLSCGKSLYHVVIRTCLPSHFGSFAVRCCRYHRTRELTLSDLKRAITRGADVSSLTL